MIATINEFRQAKAMVKENEKALIAEGVEVGKYQLGMMVEIPSTAILADKFAKEVDFLSIGTNDLIQYSMAADRMSEKVSYLYQPYNPSLLRLIKMTIDGAHKEGKWVGMCGEMAGEELAVPVLLGLGLDEFSMSASSILAARKMVRALSYEKAKILAEEVINCATEEEVVELIKKAIK
jgi:phosphotransferase system enzyme I (PtsI)